MGNVACAGSTISRTGKLESKQRMKTCMFFSSNEVIPVYGTRN